jgi:hypothetical protein
MGGGVFGRRLTIDPQQWGTVIVRADFAGCEIRWNMSFSSLLVKYWRIMSDEDEFGLFTGREYERVAPSFTPADTQR